MNFEGKDYTDMIIWESTDLSVTISAGLRNVPDEKLIHKHSIPENSVPELFFAGFTGHTKQPFRYVAVTLQMASYDGYYILCKLCQNFNQNSNL